jgi:hypothetical protein
MSAVATQQVALLRAIVAALGERASPPWWRTQFLTDVGLRTVGRIVPRTAVPAAVASTSIAARAEHDRWIGVGRRFHLFRLPSAVERAVGSSLSEDAMHSRVRDLLAARERILDELAGLAGAHIPKPVEGPLALGDARQLGKLAATATLASHYLAAFRASARCFPYFEEKA